MLGYFDVFPEKRETELRTAYFPDGDDLPFPAGTYLFTEYYCSDLSCDCQRLLVKVYYVSEPESVPEEVATISYSWNEAPDVSWKDSISDVSSRLKNRLPAIAMPIAGIAPHKNIVATSHNDLVWELDRTKRVAIQK